eukprot:463559-Pyramimonas_sp.AAC.1
MVLRSASSSRLAAANLCSALEKEAANGTTLAILLMWMRSMSTCATPSQLVKRRPGSYGSIASAETKLCHRPRELGQLLHNPDRLENCCLTPPSRPRSSSTTPPAVNIPSHGFRHAPFSGAPSQAPPGAS